MGSEILQKEKFEHWMENKELAANTIETYRESVAQYFDIFDEISKKNAIAWRRHLQEQGLKPRSINVKLNAYNAYCEFSGAPEAKVKTMKIHSATTVSNVISVSDYQRLLDGLKKDKNMQWYCNIKLLAMTGARVSEYIRLKKSDLDRGYAELWTKGKVRRIYIPKGFRDECSVFYDTLKENDLLARGRTGGLTARGVSQMLRTFAKRYDIDPAVMHPHSFRHMFAIEFLKQNNNLSLLADVMGHSSVSTTAIYTRMTKEQQAFSVDSSVKW